MNKTLLTTWAALAAIALSTLTFAGTRNNIANKADFAVLKTAIETNNYASLPDAVKAKITEAQFAKAVEKMGTKSAVDAAIEAGDYTAFRNAKIAEIPTEAEFKNMVAVKAAHATAQTAIQTAIKNNDFAAFQKAHTDLKAALVALNPDMPWMSNSDSDATKMQKRFDQMVAQYKKDGTLPEKELGKGLFMMGHGDDMKKMGMGEGKSGEKMNKNR